MRRISICNVPVDVVSRNEAIERCGSFLHESKPHHITTINPAFVVEAQKNDTFRGVLQKSDLSLADGFGITLAARWLHGMKLQRIPGVDFMIDLCALAEKEGASVFFLGGRGGVAGKTVAILQRRFPRLHIIGCSEDERIDKSIFRNVDILFVALGAPKQELWIAENLPKLPDVKIAMGVGGAFDMLSGKRKRAPQFLRRLGLEWLWRLFSEPSRWFRIFNAVIVFSSVCLKELYLKKQR